MLTTLCYIEKDEKYLMLHRVKKEKDINKDKWICIVGKFEPGESPQACLLREVTEETGLTLTHWQYRGIVTFLSDVGHEYMHLFTADGFEGQLKECDEGEAERFFLTSLHSERDTFFVNVYIQDLYLNNITDAQHICRMLDEFVGNL